MLVPSDLFSPGTVKARSLLCTSSNASNKGTKSLRLLACRAAARRAEAAVPPVGRFVEVPGALVTVADDWTEGMGASLRAGLTALAEQAPQAAAAVIVLVDQPDLDPEAIRRVGAAAGSGSSVGVAAMAVYAGHRGHPVALGRSIWEEVAALAQGDRGARDWLAAHPDRVVEADCSGFGSDRDVDTR